MVQSYVLSVLNSVGTAPNSDEMWNPTSKLCNTYMTQVTWIFLPKFAVCHHGIQWIFAKFSAERPHPLCQLAAGTYQLWNTFLEIRLSRVGGETVLTVLVKVA